MARKYARDNRGRFASKGTGATARGGRLKTASGNKRDGQTIQAKGGPKGTIGKLNKSKPQGLEPKVARAAKSRQIQASRAAAVASARANYPGVTPGQQAKLLGEAKQQRAVASSLGKQLQASKPVPVILGQGARLTGESMGRYKGGGKYSLYGKDKGRVRSARPTGTIAKPKGLKPGANQARAAAKPAAKPAGKTQVSKAEKAVAAAQRRLRTKQYGSTANQAQGLLIDRRIASMSPLQYAASQVRSTSSLARRTSRALRSPINASAPRSWRDSMTRTLADQKKAFKAAASDYRILSPKKRRK